MKITCAEALTITMGTLMVDISRVYELLNFVMTDNLYTHQLPRAARESREHLRAQMPQLAAFIDGNQCTPETWKQYLAKAICECGDEFEITPLDNSTHVDPISEMVAMMGVRS